jgi:hypothetical protein
MAVIDPSNPPFLEALPSAIDYAELRMQRDLDLLATVNSNTSFALSANTRSVTFTEGTFVTIQNVNVITPAGTSDPNSGTRNPCLSVSKEFLDYTWPSVSGATVPVWFAMLNANTLYFGPWPDQNYHIELVGTVRFTPLSASNQTNYLGTYFPDLYVQCAMIYVSEYQRQFGATANDPQMPGTYEAQYKLLLSSAQVEEARRKFSSVAWTSQSPSPVATPSR